MTAAEERMEVVVGGGRTDGEVAEKGAAGFIRQQEVEANPLRGPCSKGGGEEVSLRGEIRPRIRREKREAIPGQAEV